jgi:hypothetical protein
MMEDPMLNHKCKPIAIAIPVAEGRSIWVGELLEPVPDFPETHCIHVRTPFKDVVFGVNAADAAILAVLAQVIHGVPINPRWIDSMEKVYRSKAGA